MGGDTVTGLSETYADKNAGAGKTLSVSGYTLNDGNGGNNYTVTLVGDTTGVIDAASLVGAVLAANKTYDGTVAAAITARTLSGVMAGDSVSYVGGTATFANKNAGTGKVVTATGLSLAGADAGNYTVNSSASTTADVAALGITGLITAAGKVYDGDTSASITNRTLTGVVSGDDVAYVGGAATFADRNVGTGKTVTGTGLSLAGTDAGNYTVNNIATALADITPAALAYVATPVRIAVDTPFPTFGGSVEGFVGGDTLASSTTGTPAFDDDRAGLEPDRRVCDRRLGSVGELRQLCVRTGRGERHRIDRHTARRSVAARKRARRIDRRNRNRPADAGFMHGIAGSRRTGTVWTAERAPPAADTERSICARRRGHPAAGRRIGSVTLATRIGRAAWRVTGVFALTISFACGAAEPPPDIGTTLRELEQKRPAVPPKSDPSLRVDKTSRPALDADAAARFTVSSVRISGATAFSDLELLPLIDGIAGHRGHAGRPAGRGRSHHRPSIAPTVSRWRARTCRRRASIAAASKSRCWKAVTDNSTCATKARSRRGLVRDTLARAGFGQRHRNGTARSRSAVAQGSLRRRGRRDADAGATASARPIWS